MYFAFKGIQTHQMNTNGYGLIAFEEGKAFFENISRKKKQNEGEEARLAKYWDGRGDAMLLKDSKRILRSTSISMI